ncbi:hypothetical protein ES703_79795 [subsurface metagenome]
MANLKIEVYKAGQAEPETVVNIPLTFARMALKFMVEKAKAALEDEGINVSELAGLIEKEGVTGKLIELKKGAERIVITIE